MLKPFSLVYKNSGFPFNYLIPEQHETTQNQQEGGV